MSKNAVNVPRRAALAIILSAACAAPTLALAQADWPNRTVRLVLPMPPGTTNDITLRMLAERLSKKWGQPVVVENKPGGSTIIGTDTVAKSSADGYTILATIDLMAQNPALRKKLPFDVTKDFLPITQMNRQQLVLYVRSELPIKSIAELVAYAKAHPGKLNFASFGMGSTAHLIAEKFRVDKGVQMTHIPYKGGGEMNKALLAGEADVAVADQLSPNEYFQNGRLRVIGVTGPARVPRMPSVETLEEAGVKGFGHYSFFGLFAPAGTPTSIVHKIAEDVQQVQADPGVAKRMTEDFFVQLSTMTPEEFNRDFQSRLTNWVNVTTATGVKLD